MIYVLTNLLWLLPMESTMGQEAKVEGFIVLFLFQEAIPLIHERMMVVQNGNKKWQDSGYLLKVELPVSSEFEYVRKDKIKIQNIMKSLK